MNCSEVRSLIIAGVGGQGNIAASEIIAMTALKSGLDVRIAETHGMAQRGGAVHSIVRYGNKVFSPLIPTGACDFIISLEYMEGLRWLHYLKEGGISIVSTEVRPPYTVSVGLKEYPESLQEKYREYGKAIFVDALRLAREAGTERSANIVMIGAFSVFETFPEEDWLRSIEERFGGKYFDVNQKAFLLGRKAALTEVKPK